MKYFTSLLVIASCGMLHAGQSDIVTLRVADDQELVKVHDTLRFFYMVSKLEYDEADEFFRRLASSTCTNRLDSEQLFRIWTAAPEDKLGPGRIDITSGQQVVSLECPTLFAGLHRSLAPVYRRESVCLYTHVQELWLQDNAQYKLIPEHAQLIRQYIEPMSKEVADTIDLKKIDQADVYAYNMYGSREYLQKLIWLLSYKKAKVSVFYDFIGSARRDDWILADQQAQLLADLHAWDTAITTKDQKTQARLVGVLSKELKKYRVRSCLSPEEYRVLHACGQDYFQDTPCEVDLDNVDPLDHHDVARLAPRIQKLFIRGANGDNLYNFLGQYKWPLLRDVEIFNPVGEWTIRQRDALVNRYKCRVYTTYPDVSSLGQFYGGIHYGIH